MIIDCVKQILELTEYLAKAQQAIDELRKFGIHVQLDFVDDEFQVYGIEKCVKEKN